MRYFFPIALLGLGLTACADNSPNDTTTRSEPAATVAKRDTAKQMPVSAPIVVKANDTLVIEKKAAIFISPNDARIEKEKQKGDEEGFAVTTNDYLYYMSTAQEFLDSVKVPIVDVSNEKFIRFTANNKKSQLIEVSKLPELWSIYLFEPGKNAKQVDMTMIEEEYGSYFK
jgi:hypothetical protein